MDIGVVELSRLQFAATAMFHFLFVPLTLGLSVILVIMEAVYVMTDRPIWRQMTRFWGTLFGINFAVGVATGITMEFQFGMNWSYLSTYVGDIFGAPLALEGLMAFFLEATFVGLFFFGWDRMGKRQHLAVTCCVALGSNLSALWILIANGWMQFPVGASFNPMTMRMELTDFSAVLFSQVAQSRFVHTVSAGYLTASMFVLGVSAWYLLGNRHVALARRSIAVAASFGLAAALSVIVLGDESGYSASHNQKMKLAAIEGMWETEPAPAPFNLIGIPDQQAGETRYAVRIPWVMGLIGTRSFDTEIPGINDLVDQAEERVRSGLIAYDALLTLRRDREATDPATKARFEEHGADLGFALLLREQLDDPRQATPAQIRQAAEDTVPAVLPLFWAFRVMVGLGFLMLAMTGFFFWRANFRGMRFPRWALRLAVLMIPAPWIAAEMGWFVAEVGRQPWVVDGVLPTALAVSALSAGEVAATLAVFCLLYTALFVIEIRLLLAAIRKGPATDIDETQAWLAARRVGGAAARAALPGGGR